MIVRAIVVFDRRHRWLRTPEGADGSCVWASDKFAALLPGVRVLHLWGSRRHFLDRIDEYPARDPGYYHAVAEYRGTVIDWTRRQLDPRAAHPFIQPLWQTRREWIRIGATPEYLGL